MNNNTSETNAMVNASGVASGVNSNEVVNADSATNTEREDAKWHTVGFFHDTKCVVKDYVDNTTWSSSGRDINAAHLPDLSERPKENLEADSTYRFRVRAINNFGAGDWSAVSEFKTKKLGLPNAPNCVQIDRVPGGICISWEPPEKCDSSEIIEYSVYLAIKTKPQNDNPTMQQQLKMSFIRIYVGPHTRYVLSSRKLVDADRSCSSKPAIIFRIAARNGNGYGPAIQVRWLQELTNDVAASSSSQLNNTKP